jgi:hypothetical protein
MKTTQKFAALLIGLSTLLFSCDNFKQVIPNSSIVSSEYRVGSYSGIQIENAFNVEVTQVISDEKITVEANSNLLEYIEVFEKNDQLVIKIRKGVTINGTATLNVVVNTSQRLSTISAVGAAKLKLNDTIVGNDIDVTISGASHVTGDFKCNTLNIYADGASDALLSGSATNIYINAEGACSIGSFDLAVTDTDLKLEGASKATLTIDGKIRLSANGASMLTYKGQATIDHLSLEGGSQIIKAD